VVVVVVVLHTDKGKKRIGRCENVESWLRLGLRLELVVAVELGTGLGDG